MEAFILNVRQRPNSTTFAIVSAMPGGQPKSPEQACDYGTDQAFLKTVVDHWLHHYDWRSTEAEVNAIGSFVTEAAGQRVHFLHARSDSDRALPLVITHGWPGSIVEFLDALPLLRRRFHVVLVSMPGYGFSGPTPRARR